MAARATGTTRRRGSRRSASRGVGRPGAFRARPADGAARRFWVGVFLMIFVIGLIIWGLVSEEGEDEEYYEEYDDLY